MKLALKKVLVCAAGLLAIIAFCMMFATPIRSVMGNTVVKAEWKDVYFGVKGSLITIKGATISFIGYLLILLAGIAAVVLSFLKLDEKVSKIAMLACAGVLFIGAIFVWIVKAAYYGANDSSPSDYDHTAFGPVLAGILAVIAAAAIAVPQFIKLPELKK